MQTRKLGMTDLSLSVIGLGTWAIGGSGWDYGWGPQDEQDSIDAIHEALDHGVNWIDTAAIYGIGRSEEVVGRALKQSGRKDIVVATKCGLLGDTQGHVTPCITPQSIATEVDASLKRLAVEVIDLYQIHWPKPPGEIDAAWQTMQKLREQGKIRWAGVSNFSARQLQSISKHAPVVSLQPPYSLIKREVEQDALPWCVEHECGVISYSPLQCGALTGKVTRDWIATLPDSDWRKKGLIYFQEPRLSALMELVSSLQEIAAESRRTVAQLAVCWVINQQGITSAIVGARKRGQIPEIVPAAVSVLSKEELAAIEAAYQRYLTCSKQ